VPQGPGNSKGNSRHTGRLTRQSWSLPTSWHPWAPLHWVRAGSVPQRTHTGISGHQRSPTVQRNSRLLPLQLKQLG
jgi:hypothetical protein